LTPVIIAVVGRKKSGKTVTIEALTRDLTERGYSVAVVKHIPEENFTIDTEGKDTWRFAQAGARTIIAVSPHEIDTIEKRNLNDTSLEQILKKCRGNDVVFLEGFRRSLARNKRIPKIVTAKSAEEAHEAMGDFEPVLVFVGPFSTENANAKVPCVNALVGSKRLADIVENLLRKRVKDS
jgi:molybdopterin-guanine dinucleotide biosynthesis protein MobB